MKRSELPPNIIKTILDESKELTNDLDLYILDLEKNPDNQDQFNRIFRVFHGIKGSTGNVDDFKPISKFAHRVETLLSKIRAGEIKMSNNIGSVLLKSLDMIQIMIMRAEENKDVLDIDTSIVDDEIRDIIEGKIISEEKGAPKPSVGTLAKEEKALRVDVARVDKLINSICEFHINERMLTHGISNIQNMISDLSAEINKIISTHTNGNGSIIAGMKKKIKDLLISFDELSGISDEVDIVSDELKSVTLEMRMVPIKQLFKRAIRIVRDISAIEGKEVNIQSFGEDTNVDKNIIEGMHDPLIHIIRNAVDHGIETREAREKAGKPPAGDIILKAFHSGGNLFIEINDDGRGIDIDAISQKAVEKNIYSNEDIAKMSEKEILNTIFLPGFSTKEKVSEVSGRGVGMDILRENVSKLKGEITLTSRKGKGTSLSIMLPLTLMISESLLVEVCGEIYAITMGNLLEIIKIDGAYIDIFGENYTLQFEGKTTPIIDLKKIFSTNIESFQFNWNEIYTFAVVRSMDRIAALHVDRIIAIEDIVVKGMGSHLSSINNFEGATILEDGTVSLILNIKDILSKADDRERSMPLV